VSLYDCSIQVFVREIVTKVDGEGNFYTGYENLADSKFIVIARTPKDVHFKINQLVDVFINTDSTSDHFYRLEILTEAVKILLEVGDTSPAYQFVSAYTSVQPNTNKYVLAIGIADYEGEENDLWNSDLGAIKTALELMKCGYKVELLLNKFATAERIAVAVDKLGDYLSVPQSKGVFYYAGHGYSLDEHGGPESIHGLTATNGYGVSDRELAALLAGVVSEEFLIFLDTCYAAGTAYELQAAGRLIVCAATWDTLASSGHEWMEMPSFTYYFITTLIQHPNWSAEKIFDKVAELYAGFDEGYTPYLYDGYEGNYYIL